MANVTNGTVRVTVSGGVGPYQYTLLNAGNNNPVPQNAYPTFTNPVNGVASSSFTFGSAADITGNSGLAPGSYKVKIVDGNGCETISTVLTVINTPEPTSTPIPDPTATPVPDPTATVVPDPTATQVVIDPTATPVPDPTATQVVIDPTATPVPDPTATAIPDPTATPVPDPTATAIPDPTATAIPDPTATPVPDPTATAIPDPTATAIPDPTATPVPEANSYWFHGGTADDGGLAGYPYQQNLTNPASSYYLSDFTPVADYALVFDDMIATPLKYQPVYSGTLTDGFGWNYDIHADPNFYWLVVPTSVGLPDLTLTPHLSIDGAPDDTASEKLVFTSNVDGLEYTLYKINATEDTGGRALQINNI